MSDKSSEPRREKPTMDSPQEEFIEDEAVPSHPKKPQKPAPHRKPDEESSKED